MMDFGFASNKEIRMALTSRLREQRLARELSQQDLAERAGVGVATLRRLESTGESTLENFVRVLMALGLAEQLQPLFALKVRSIAQMEYASGLKRLRAPRRRRQERALKASE